MTDNYTHPFDRDLLTPKFMANPYPYYQQLREENPVFWSQRLRAWIISRYADVEPALHDRRLNSGDRVAAILDELPKSERKAFQPLVDHLTKWLGFTDPPDHDRLRRLIGLAFTPRMMEDLRPTIQAIADDLLDDVVGQDQFDVVGALAFSQPFNVIMTMLGVREAERADFRRWSNAIGHFISAGGISLERARNAQEGVFGLREYFHGLAERRRQQPQDDLLSALVALEDGGDSLTHNELISMCVQLLFAGHETTEGSIGLGMLALFRNPDQMKQLRDTPSLIKPAVEELLRYDTSVQRQARVLSDDMEIDGHQLRKGQYLLVFIAAANRDPAKFTDPDRLDITRQPNPHVSFGFGLHYCIGRPLGRVELQVAFNTLLQRFPNLRLPEQSLAYEKLLALRKLKSLVVAV